MLTKYETLVKQYILTFLFFCYFQLRFTSFASPCYHNQPKLREEPFGPIGHLPEFLSFGAQLGLYLKWRWIFLILFL